MNFLFECGRFNNFRPCSHLSPSYQGDHTILILQMKKLKSKDFPGALVAETLRSQCTRAKFHPWSGD